MLNSSIMIFFTYKAQMEELSDMQAFTVEINQEKLTEFLYRQEFQPYRIERLLKGNGI